MAATYYSLFITNHLLPNFDARHILLILKTNVLEKYKLKLTKGVWQCCNTVYEWRNGHRANGNVRLKQKRVCLVAQTIPLQEMDITLPTAATQPDSCLVMHSWYNGECPCTHYQPDTWVIRVHCRSRDK